MMLLSKKHNVIECRVLICYKTDIFSILSHMPDPLLLWLFSFDGSSVTATALSTFVIGARWSGRDRGAAAFIVFIWAFSLFDELEVSKLFDEDDWSSLPENTLQSLHRKRSLSFHIAFWLWCPYAGKLSSVDASCGRAWWYNVINSTMTNLCHGNGIEGRLSCLITLDGLSHLVI